MKYSKIFFLMIFLPGCSEDDLSDKVRVVGQIFDEVAFLDIERVGTDSLGFVFELQSPSEFKFLSVTDRSLICDTLPAINCLAWHSIYLQNYLSRDNLTPSRTSGRRLWYKISGDVLSLGPNYNLVGNPFTLTRLERILSCPVNYQVLSGSVPMADTEWRLLGFVDDSDRIYSHPACESNHVVLKFTSESLDNYPFNLPDGKMVYIGTGDYLNYLMAGQILSYSVLEGSDKIMVKYLSSPYYIPGFRNYVQHDGPRTLETKNKSDSLLRIFGHSDSLDFVLENNILKLSNSNAKLKAMFVAN